MKRVILILPRPAGGEEAETVHGYGSLAINRCLQIDEAPFSASLMYPWCFYTTSSMENREMAEEAEEVWAASAELVVVYTDAGVSDDMNRQIKKWEGRGLGVEYRTLFKPVPGVC